MRLPAVVFACGAVVMSLEIAGSRVIAPAYGNSLYAWGSLIGVILGSLSIGYYYGGRAADKSPSMYKLSMIILAAGLFTSFIPLISGLILQPEMVRLLGMKYGPLVSVTLLFGAPSILLGIVSPYAVKLEAKKMEFVGKAAGNLYAISTLGSILGTFLTSFFLIPEMGIKAIIYSLAVALFLAALLCSGKRLLPGVLLASIVFAVVLFLTPAYAGVAGPRYKVVLEKDTAYCEMTIADSIDSSKRFMFLDRWNTGARYMNSSEAVYQYTDYFHLPMAVNPGAEYVLFIGGGAGTGPKRFYEEYPSVRIDVVDIDPEVNYAAEKYFGLTADERLHIYDGDGRFFLSGSGQKYDIIVVDAFSSKSSVPFHLLTREFMSMAKDHLNVNGSLLFNIHGSVKGPKGGLSCAVYRTAKEVFPYVHAFNVGTDPYALQNMIIIGSASENDYSKQEYVEKAQQLADKGGVKNLEAYAGHYVEGLDDSKAPVLTDDHAPVDNLLISLIDA